MPDDSMALNSADHEVNLGVSLQSAGNLQGAVECFRRALAIDPSSFAAYNHLGGVFASLRDWATALIFVRAAVELQPGSAEIQGNLGHLLLKQGEREAAIESYRRAATLAPNDASYADALGKALLLAGRYPEAEASLLRALTLDPAYAEAHANLGYLCSVLLRPGAVVEEHYGRAIALKPGLAQAHVNLSHCLLRRGAFAEGWMEQEWRWRWNEFPSPRRNFAQPQWRGAAIEGARILLHAEQGFGDTIQFVRYVAMVVERGAQVILEVHPELRSLIAGSMHGIEVISRGDPLPEFAWQCPLLSLPMAFGTELDSVPAEVPYLWSEGAAPAWLRKERPAGLAVGLVWAGGAINVIDRERSLSLAALEALWDVRGVAFYSLQRGPVSAEAESGPLAFAGCQPQTGDFAATAAAISQLDLVISVDTAVAHLAGAMGKPVWILLPARADWRWLTEREDSPWYPSARLFRQTVDGDWSPVIAGVATELARVVEDRALLMREG